MVREYRQIDDPVWRVLVPEAVMDDAYYHAANKFAEYVRQSDLPVKVAVITTGAVDFSMKVFRIFVRQYPELMRKVSYQIIDVTSQDDQGQAEEVTVNLDKMGEVKDHIIVIFDDIFDSGRTVNHLDHYLRERGAADVKIITMLLKKDKKAAGVSVTPDWYAVEVIDVYVAGCGLDGGKKFQCTRLFPDIRYDCTKHQNMPSSRWYIPSWEKKRAAA